MAMIFPPLNVNAETLRWGAAVAVSIVTAAVTTTWAVANAQRDNVSSIERLSEKFQASEVQQKAVAQAILKELDSQVARQDLRNQAVGQRVTELETIAKTNAAVLATLEGLKTEVRYLSATVAELRADMREQRQ